MPVFIGTLKSYMSFVEESSKVKVTGSVIINWGMLVFPAVLPPISKHVMPLGSTTNTFTKSYLVEGS